MTSPKAPSAVDHRRQLTDPRLAVADARGRKMPIALRGKVAHRRGPHERSRTGSPKKDRILFLHEQGMSVAAITREVVAPDSYVRSVIRRHEYEAQNPVKVHPNRYLVQAKSRAAKVPSGLLRRASSRHIGLAPLSDMAPPQVVQIAAIKLAKALGAASPGELISTTSTLTSTDVPGWDDDHHLLGPAPTRKELADAVLVNLRKQFTVRKAVESESISRDDVATALGTSTTAVGDWLDSGKLCGFRVGRRWMIPAWQLDADTTDGLAVGLKELIEAFPGGAVPLTRWVHKPSADLAGSTPYDAMKEGRAAEVAASARALVP